MDAIAILGNTREKPRYNAKRRGVTPQKNHAPMDMESFECPCRQPFGDSDDEDMFVFESDDECRLRQQEESLAEYQTLLRKKTLQQSHIQIDIDKTAAYIKETVHKIALLRASVESQQPTVGGK